MPSREVYVAIGGKLPAPPPSDAGLIIHVPQWPKPGTVVEGDILACIHEGDPGYFGRITLISLSEDTTHELSRREIRFFPLSHLERELGPVATFIGRREPYRDLIGAFGPQTAKRLLLRAKDIAALQVFAENSAPLRALRKRGMLSRLVHSDEQQFTFLSLRSLLNEKDRDLGLPSDVSSLRARISIDGTSAFDFVADFGKVLGERQPVTAIIGANGVGKSRLLVSLGKAALRGKLEVEHRQGRERLPAVHVVSFTYEKALWSSVRRDLATVENLGIAAKDWRILTSILRQLALSESRNFRLPAYLHVANKVVNTDLLFVPVATPPTHGTVTIGNQQYLPLRQLERASSELLSHIEPGKPVIVYTPDRHSHSLSSGQKSLLLLIARLFLHGERSLVLIDEPENHLHPQFVTLLMQTLQSTLVAMESRAVLVTHSPFVIRELDKTAVQILDNDANGIPCLYQTSLQTFGADIGRISDYVFGDQSVTKGYQERVKNAFDDPRKSPAALEQEIGLTLGDDAELYLHQLMRSQRDAN